MLPVCREVSAVPGTPESADIQSLHTVVLRVGQQLKGRSHLLLTATESPSKSPDCWAGAPALPGKPRTCLQAGTGCKTAAFAQREDENTVIVCHPQLA